MNLQSWFWAAHVPALAGWLALLIGRGGAAIPIARAAALILALGYLVIFVPSGSAASVLAMDYSLQGVAAFFDDPRLQLLGWVHYLAFDLWVGSWEAEEAQRTGMSRWLLAPSLLLTLMLGPIGLLLFLLLRARGRQAVPAA